MRRIHICVCIDGLIREISNKRSDKQRNKLALAFIQNPDPFPEPYIQLLTELGKMKSKGWNSFTSGECDNVQDDGSCGGHTINEDTI